MKKILIVLSVFLLLFGCSKNNSNNSILGSSKETISVFELEPGTVSVIGYLGYDNEFQHGIWLIEIPKGTVETVKVLRTNSSIWEFTESIKCNEGIFILSKPEPLSIGNKYRLEIRP